MKRLKNIKNLLKKILIMLEKNFSYEARSLHYNQKQNKKKGIYGSASFNEIKELKDEGIDTEMIPWIEDKNN